MVKRMFKVAGRLAAAALLLLPALAAAQDEGRAGSLIEEIRVTAEKREQSVQETPIAVSAFDAKALEEANIANSREIQFAVPNTLYSRTNFGGANFVIRGIGNNAIAQSSDSGTGVHFNGAYMQGTFLFEADYFDVARVEVLRGPQGTLYGRNTTAGVINVIPNKPQDVFAANARLVGGDFGEKRITSTFNLPIIPSIFNARASLYSSKRDGFVYNEFTKRYVDSRNIEASRVSARIGGDPGGSFELTFFRNRFKEEDTRLRTSKQLCHRQDDFDFPHNMGCYPNRSLYDSSPDLDGAGVGGDGSNPYETFPGYSTLAGLITVTNPTLAAVQGITRRLPTTPVLAWLASSAAAPATPFTVTGLQYNKATDFRADAKNPSDLRRINSAVDPYFMVDEDVEHAELNWDWGRGWNWTFVVHEGTVMAKQNTDYNWTDGGNPLDGNPLTPGVVDPLTTGDPKKPGGRQVTDINRSSASIAWDEGGNRTTYETTEVRLVTDWTGWFNFTVGAFTLDSTTESYYEVHANILAAAGGGLAAIPAPLATVAGCPGVDPYRDVEVANCATLGFYRNNTDLYQLESSGAFAEFYIGGGSWRLTYGTRTTEEEKRVRDRQTLLNDPTLAFVPGISNRASLATQYRGLPLPGTTGWYWAFDDNGDPKVYELDGTVRGDLTLANTGQNYRAGYASGAASNGSAVNNGAVPLFCKGTVTTNCVGLRGGKWDEPSSKIGLDIFLGERALLYFLVTSSYKSGGVNPPAFTGSFPATFRPEIVDATEVGVKLSWRRALFNLTFFQYDYKDMQISKIVDRTSVNENIDAEITGAEVEFRWSPSDRWLLGLTASYLDTEVLGGSSINTADPANYYRKDSVASGGTVKPRFLNTKNLDSSVFLVENPAAIGTDGFTGFNANMCEGENAKMEGGTLVCADVFMVNPYELFIEVIEDDNGDPVRTSVGRPTPMRAGGRTVLKPAAELPWETEAQRKAMLEKLTTKVPIGIAVDLKGKQLPSAPKESVNATVAYQFDWDGSQARFRVDYYWQDEFFYRVYNTEQDRIRQWQVWNASFAVSAPDNSWELEAWIKNLADKDHITGGYFTDASSGNFTNVFLLEPRTFGISLNFNY